MKFRISLSRLGLAILGGAALAAPLAAAAGPWVEHEQVGVRLLSRWAAATSGSDAGLGLEFRMAAGWHVYWKNPGDAGYPPKLTLLAGPVSAPEIRYPAPHRFDLPGGLVSFGYGDDVVYPLDATLHADATTTARLEAEIDYLACAEQCIPFRDRLTLELPLAAVGAEDPEIAPLLERWRARLPRPLASLPGGAVTAELRRAKGPELDLDLAVAADGLAAGAPELFFEAHPLLVVERPQPGPAPGAWTVHLRPLDETKPLPERLELGWTASGFKLAGAPVAVDGRLALDRPDSAAVRAAPIRRLAAVVAVALIAWFVYRRLRAAPSSNVRGS